jgi:hypothetical protein
MARLMIGRGYGMLVNQTAYNIVRILERIDKVMITIVEIQKITVAKHTLAAQLLSPIL